VSKFIYIFVVSYRKKLTSALRALLTMLSICADQQLSVALLQDRI